MAELVVASFNLHVGVDGWGLGFDAVGACDALGADVLVLQEAFATEAGGSLVATIASALGYRVLTVPLAPVRRFPADPHRPPPDGAGWGPRRGTRARPFIVDPAPGVPRARRTVAALPARRRRARVERGTWELAVLHRPPATATKVVPLPQLSRDVAARQVALVELDTPGGRFTICGTHLAHLGQGSPLQIRALGQILADVDGPSALLGDMNCFGLPLVAALPGWRRAVRGRSWPTWRPAVQPDHVLVNAAVRVISGTVVHVGGSDHYPVRAHLRF